MNAPLYKKGERVQMSAACVRFNEYEAGESFKPEDVRGYVKSEPLWDDVAERFVTRDGEGDWRYNIHLDSGDIVDMHEQMLEPEGA